MSALEREIIEKFRQLPSDAKARIRALIEAETASKSEQANAPEFNYELWSRHIEALRKEIDTQ